MPPRGFEATFVPDVNEAITSFLAVLYAVPSELLITKNLSVNCQIEQNVSRSELSEGRPVLGFLAPASANAASFGKPGDGAFDDPTASGKALLTGYRALLKLK